MIVNNIVEHIRGLLNSYVNDEAGQEQKEKYEKMTDEDILDLFWIAVDCYNLRDKMVNAIDEELDTDIVIMFDMYEVGAYIETEEIEDYE